MGCCVDRIENTAALPDDKGQDHYSDSRKPALKQNDNKHASKSDPLKSGAADSSADTQPTEKQPERVALADRKGELSPPLGDFRSWGRPAGLDNLGNTCYMNSVLQCLARTPDLLDALEGKRSDPVVNSLARLLRACRSKRDVREELKDFRRELGLKLQKFRGMKQEDSKDFILELISYIEKVHRPAAELFYGRRADKVTCLKCGTQIPAEAELFIVPIERQRAIDVSKYLQRAQNDDEVQLTGENKLKCSICQCQTEASVITKIVGSPRILIVYIEPFDMYGRRIKQSVSYTESVTLLGRQYALFGVVCHHGSSIHSGHFTAKVKYSHWFLCDDGYVSQLSSLSRSEAYFLFYEAVSD